MKRRGPISWLVIAGCALAAIVVVLLEVAHAPAEAILEVLE